MRMCSEHWSQLKQAIDDRGLTHLIAKDGKTAFRQIQEDLSGAPEKETFDPLMAANFAIWSNAIDMGGLYLMGHDDQGNEYCPVCESTKHNGPSEDWWINNAANDAYTRAVEYGLVSKPV